ncbi:YmjA family protein [Enterobacter bugandensis]|uniref:YmjA family protein n=1 Tax=Enterobacter sp. TaxID=42895 RepID=UPI0031D0138C
MNHDIPLKFYDIVDEYSTETQQPVSESERDPLAHYFQLLIARLNNNEEIDEDAQKEMADVAGIQDRRIDDVANFLNQWGNE